MIFLVYGLKGWIGEQLKREMDKLNIKYIEGNVRAVNQKELINEIMSINPTHIISLIGRTYGKINDIKYKNIDYLQDSSKISENIRDNLYSPIVLAILCEQMSIHFTYLGTGCLFEYDNLHPFNCEDTGFTPEDVPNFEGSNYSIVKGFTDRLMHLFSNTLNVRVRMCLTSDSHWKNFLTKFITYEKICSTPNSISVLPDLLPILLDMAINKVTGTINLTNPGLITHNEILQMYKEIVDPNFNWINMTLDEQSKILDAKRCNNYLDVTRLQELYPNVKHVKDAVRDCLLNYK
jgi:hypothetical protein